MRESVPDDLLDEIIRQNALGGPIKWICVAIEILLFLICVPIMYKYRRKPMIYFRCWSMQATSVFFLISHKAAEAAIHTPGLVNTSNYTTLKAISMGATCMLFPSFIAMILRHHFLLQHPPIQAGLAMIAKTSDSEQYVRIYMRLKRNKLLYSTFSTWMYWLIHSAALLTFMTIMFVFYYSMEDDILGIANSYTIVSVVLMILEPFLMSLLLLTLIPQKPQENYAITRQLQVITWLTASNNLIAIICSVLPQTMYVRVITISNAALFPLLISAADLIIQIWPDEWNLLTFKRRSRHLSYPSLRRTLKGGVSKSATSSSCGRHDHHVTANQSNPNLFDSMGRGMGSLSRAARLESLDDILHSPTRLEKFHSFMCREFCLENILFLVAIARYKTEVLEHQDMESNLALVRSLYREYVEPGAINELNLPQSIAKEIFSKIERFEKHGDLEGIHLATLFDEAEAHIGDLVVSNNLGRFLMYDETLNPIRFSL